MTFSPFWFSTSIEPLVGRWYDGTKAKMVGQQIITVEVHEIPIVFERCAELSGDQRSEEPIAYPGILGSVASRAGFPALREYLLLTWGSDS